jgi:hypothetical protein
MRKRKTKPAVALAKLMRATERREPVVSFEMKWAPSPAYTISRDAYWKVRE